VDGDGEGGSAGMENSQKVFILMRVHKNLGLVRRVRHNKTLSYDPDAVLS
jgi:hypothetical protein